MVLLSSDQITLGSSELKAFATTGYSPGFNPDMSFCTLRVRFKHAVPEKRIIPFDHLGIVRLETACLVTIVVSGFRLRVHAITLSRSMVL